MLHAHAPPGVRPAPAARPRARHAVPAAAGAAGAPAPRAGKVGLASAEAGALKARIRQLAGPNYGLDLDPRGKAAVEGAAAELAALAGGAPPAAVVAAGETYVPVFNNSSGNSSGKLGPFVTAVEQVFPADQPGIYYNVSRLGPLTLALRGAWSVSPANPARVNLEFKDVTFKLFDFQLGQKVWEAGAMRGHWQAVYWDEDFRVFTTNKGSLFIMARRD